IHWNLFAGQLPQGKSGLDAPRFGRALDSHEPLRVPIQVSPAILAHAATLIDLKVEVGAVIAVQIEQDADAVEWLQVGIAPAVLDRGELLSGRMLAAQGDVEKILIV